MATHTKTLLAAPGPLAGGADLEQLLKASNKTLADVDVLLFADGAAASGAAASYEHALLRLGGGDADALPGAVAKMMRPGSAVTVHPGALTAVSLSRGGRGALGGGDGDTQRRRHRMHTRLPALALA